MQKAVKKNRTSNLLPLFTRIFFLLFLILPIISPDFVYSDNSQNQISLNQWGNPKEYVADSDKFGNMVWCGKDEVLSLYHKALNISAFVFFKRDLTDFKNNNEDTININITDLRVHSCSSDGQYVYFMENNKEKDFKGFRYFDRHSKKIGTVFSYDKNVPKAIANELLSLSPKRNYIIGTAGFNKLTLPGTGEVTVIPFDTFLNKTSSSSSDSNRFSNIDIDWDPFERKVYLLDYDAQVLSIVDPKTLQREKIKVKINKYEVTSIKATGNLNKLFLIANRRYDIQGNIYLLDLANKKKPITLFLSDVGDIEVSAVGLYVYKKTFGAKQEPNYVYFERDADKRYAVINLIDDNHNEKTIKKTYFGTGPNSLAVFSEPIISPDASTLAFISYDTNDRKKKKIHVLKSK